MTLLKDFAIDQQFVEDRINELLENRSFEVAEADAFRTIIRCEKLADGVFVTSSLNAHLLFDFAVGRPSCSEALGVSPDHGVVDDPSQIVNQVSGLDDPDHVFAIFATPILKKHEPPRDGWRWEKWGPYLGTREPKADYLFDEPEIDLVYVFHVYEVFLQDAK